MHKRACRRDPPRPAGWFFPEGPRLTPKPAAPALSSATSSFGGVGPSFVETRKDNLDGPQSES
jgi:hypothetical protein